MFPCSGIAFGVKDDGTFDIISIPVNGKSSRLYNGLGKGGGTDHKHTGLKLNTVTSGIVSKLGTWISAASYRPNRFRMSKASNTRIYTTTVLVDDAVRTLMPNSVYNFFIHYVRKDGTYTNGYQLSNDILPTTILNTVTMTGSSTIDVQLSSLTSLKERTSSSTSGNDRDFTNLLSIEALKDKYAYEIVSTAPSPSNATIRKAASFGYYKNYNNDLLFKTGSSHSFDSANDNTLYRIKVGLLILKYLMIILVSSLVMKTRSN